MNPDKPRRKASPKKAKDIQSRRNHIMGRFGFVILLVLMICVSIIVLMTNTIIVHGSDWKEKGNAKMDTILPIPPTRGDILADDGSILATNLYYYNIRLDFTTKKFMICEYDQSLDSLADTLAAHFPNKGDAEYFRERLREPLKKHVDKRSNSYLLLREVTSDDVEKIKDFPYFRRTKNHYRTGLVVEKVLRRKYPYGDMAKLSVGFIASDSVIRNRYYGAAGLEKALDSLLYGTPGEAKKVVFTNRVANWPVKKPVPGYNVHTTINVTIQDILENELEKMLVTSEAEWGTAMIMEVETGDIKAISNLELDSAKGKGNYHEAMNRIVLGYEPGSVMKAISMAMALEEGIAKPLGKTLYSDPGGFAYAGGKRIRDTHSTPTRQLTVDQLLEYSSNIGMTKLIAPTFADNPAGFKAKLKEMGFFNRFNTGIARENPPRIPDLPADRGGRISLSRQIYGYNTEIPPLYTCAVYNAIANRGKFVRPRLVRRLSRQDGTDSIIPVQLVVDHFMTEENADILKDMLHRVIYNPGGTAKGLKSDIVDIAGKTGTCNIVVPGRGYREGHYRLAFCGFFPYESPKYTCMVLISDPSPAYKGAGRTSGEVLKNVALKMHARGLLGDSPAIAKADDAITVPGYYATDNTGRDVLVSQAVGVEKGRKIASPKSVRPGTVPDVRGLGFREAVVKLEKAGFNVKYTGSGFVAAQNPNPGAEAILGAKVNLSLTQN